ncbi:MAG: hypothetical protein AB1597_00305 [Chloroflexota bacterium]
MAHTSLSKVKTNQYVRDALVREFPGRTFAPKSLSIGRKSDLLQAKYEFDAVSDDGTVVAIVDDGPGLSGDGERDAGRVATLYQKLYFLTLTTAITKWLVLTDRDAYLGFSQESDGKLAKGIKLHHIPGPETKCKRGLIE